MANLSLVAILVASIGFTGPESPVTGQYLEDRSSRVYGCPCEWSSEYVSYGREAVLAWKVESGEFEGESLAGLRLVAALAGEFTLSEPSSLRHSTVFVDSEASAAQRTAGVAWLRSRYGDVLGRVLGVHVAPIEFKVDSESATVRVADLLEVQMRRANFLEDTLSWASLLFDPLIKLASSTLGTTTNAQFSGPDLQIRWTRRDAAITGYYGKFSIQ